VGFLRQIVPRRARCLSRGATWYTRERAVPVDMRPEPLDTQQYCTRDVIRPISDSFISAIGPLDTPEKVASLLTLLCGETVRFEGLSPEAQSIIRNLVDQLPTTGLTCAQFNELLLLFNQDRVQLPFFRYFFAPVELTGTIDVERMKQGVMRFRAFAMLCFGNFRFAFRKLSQDKDPRRLERALHPWNLDSESEENTLKSRKPPLARITGSADHIDGANTWLLGYLSSQLIDADSQALDSMSREADEASKGDVVGDLRRLNQELETLESRREVELAKGRRNTVKYLTWDHLDVYVATSMRQAWEFESTYRFIEEVFVRELSDLPRIRWFDPTQSYCDSIIDKGLVEALMLKRAKCTIYMAQETDTLGKDSELAATLAQGKPVIAYVPQINEDKLAATAAELAAKPPGYFRQRLLALLAEGFFDKPDNRIKVSERARALGVAIQPTQLKARIQDSLQLFARFERERRFFVIGDDERRFQQENRSAIVEEGTLLAAIESVAADARAVTIKLRHPLGMQVHLETGVANGVLVARSAKQCADLIRGILARDLAFRIEPVIEPQTGRDLGTALVDDRTSSRFRFVTSDEAITNSFWNFYLERNGVTSWQMNRQPQNGK
jgi:hypothetical protein